MYTANSRKTQSPRRHCEEVDEDVKATIEKEEDRINKYKKDGDPFFLEANIIGSKFFFLGRGQTGRLLRQPCRYCLKYLYKITL